MIGCCRHLVVAQIGCKVVHCGTTQAIDDATVVRMAEQKLHDGHALLPCIQSSPHFQAQVGTVKRGYEHARIREVELFQDVQPGHLVRRGRKGYDRHPWKLGTQHIQLGIFGTEIMSPAGYAMRLVNGKKAHLRHRILEKIQIRQQAFGRHVQDLHLTLQTLATRFLVFGLAHSCIERTGYNATRNQRLHLVLHQGNERRHHHCHAPHHQCGHLVADALSGTSGHQHQRILSLHQPFHNFALKWPKSIISKVVLEYFLHFFVIIDAKLTFFHQKIK